MKRVYTLSYDHVIGARTLANLTLFELIQKLNEIEESGYIVPNSVVISTQEIK
jgi:hypothetical protein